jgi:hypothetical protein
MNTLRAAVIGHIAKQVFQRNSTFQTAGMTSQGIFLQPPGDFTLFATAGHFRGPLTLNIMGETGNLTGVFPRGKIAQVGDRLVFEGNGLTISLQNPLLWEPPEPPVYSRQTKTQVAKVVQQTASIYPDHPYSALLEFAAGSGSAPLKDIPGLEHRLSSLSSSLDQGKSSSILAGMKELLGAGPGLTPLGDDLLQGILLAISRSDQLTLNWQEELDNPQTLLAAARNNTTSLSWSLLSSSAQGSADERIIQVLDGLLTGREIPDQDLMNVLEWGSSSGVGVLAGMLLILSRRD